MQDVHLGVLYPAIMGIVNDNYLLCEFSGAASLATHQGDGLQAVFTSPRKRLEHIGRITADADGDENISAASVILQLPDKGIFVGVVVPDRGEPRNVIVQGKHPEALANGIGRGFAEISREMRGVRRTAPI